MTHVHYDPAAEIAVLGCMMLEPDAAREGAEALDSADFYRPGNGKAFAAMQRLHARGEVIEPGTLAIELRSVGDLESAGGMAFIASIVDAVPSALGVGSFIRAVQEAAALRRLDNAAREVLQVVAGARGRPAVEVHAEAQRIIGDVVAPSRGPALVGLKSLLWPAMEELEAIGTPNEQRGIRTGLTDVDRLIGGMMPGDLVILAARPSMGKSGMALGNIAAHAALEEGKRVAVFSQETKKSAIARRLLAAEARVNLKRAKTRGCLADDDYPRLAQAAGLLNTAAIHIDDSPGLTIPQMRGKLRQVTREEGPVDLIVEDYLGKMSHPGARGDRYREVSYVSNGLKEIAMEFGAPVLALSQLSRKVEDRPDKRPMMSDLRDSGEIEQDADLIMLLYRPEYYFGPERRTKGGDVENLEGRAEVIIGKQRDGETGSAVVFFEKELARFADWSRP